MPITTYNCTDLTGGGARALDALSVADLHAGDRAIVADGSDNFRYFEFQATATDAETTTTPAKIRPDDYSTGGVWYEQTLDSNYYLNSADYAALVNWYDDVTLGADGMLSIPQLVLVPRADKLSAVQGGIFYDSDDDSVYVCTAAA